MSGEDTERPAVTDAPSADGRRARRDRNRERVLDAVIELFAADHLVPSAQAVADRAGVSLRSIYRYFDDHDDLLRAAVDHHLEHTAPLAAVPDLGQGPLEDRIERLVTARLRLYRAVAPTARAVRATAHSHRVVGREARRATDALRRQVERHFASELARLDPPAATAVLTSVDTLCQHPALDYLDQQRGLSDEQIHEVLVGALGRLLRA